MLHFSIHALLLRLTMFCPDDELLWCNDNRALALAESAQVQSSFLTSAQVKAMLPTYERLTSKKLLFRCIQGKPQNVAESLNSKIWLLCYKTRFASYTVAELTTYIEIFWCNKGHKYFQKLLQKLGILSTQELITLGNQRDLTRI